MKFIFPFGVLFVALFFSVETSVAQTEDCRSLSGLPMQIGQPVICGQVKLRGLGDKEQRPVVTVILLVGGVQADRAVVNETGYYTFFKSPSNNSAIVVEVNNLEVGRVVLAAGLGSNVRKDFEIDMQSIRSQAQAPPGVISVQTAYTRDPAAEREFTAAMSAVKAKKTDEAINLFKQIVARDAKDFVAWTELGTLFFSASKFDDAEAAYARAVNLKSDFMPALMNRGKLLMSQKKWDKAADSFYKAVTVDAASADAFAYLGESYLQLKQGSKAVLAMNEAIRLAPTEKAELHLRLAALYDAAKLKDKAANEYRQFLAKKPNYPDKEKIEKYISENSK